MYLNFILRFVYFISTSHFPDPPDTNLLKEIAISLCKWSPTGSPDQLEPGIQPEKPALQRYIPALQRYIPALQRYIPALQRYIKS
jgi:hypothetical protein